MENDHLTDTYKLLYEYIMVDLLAGVCNAKSKYCVRSHGVPYELGKTYETYINRAKAKLDKKRLDRHKLASCFCGAIIETKPLTGYQNAVIPKIANEYVALYAGMAVVKFYMINDLADKEAYPYLKDHFEIKLPPSDQNVCDTQEYVKNLGNALYWSNSECNQTRTECFSFDIWAYATIFYHLELYNKPFLQTVYDQYLKQRK